MKRAVIIAKFLLLTAYALFAQTPPQGPEPGPEHQTVPLLCRRLENRGRSKAGPFLTQNPRPPRLLKNPRSDQIKSEPQSFVIPAAVPDGKHPMRGYIHEQRECKHVCR